MHFAEDGRLCGQRCVGNPPLAELSQGEGHSPRVKKTLTNFAVLKTAPGMRLTVVNMMQTRKLLAALVIVLAGFTTIPSAVAAPASATDSALGRHPCTRTSSGSCIQGGQFCPRASYGHSGWDARGRRYVCKGNRAHPHWMRP